MRKVTVPVLLFSLSLAAPLSAQEARGQHEPRLSSGIVDAAVGAALRMELQPPTQVAVPGRRSGLLWAGVAMIAGGGALAALSGSVLADDSVYYGLYGSRHAETSSDRNEGAYWGGIGIAGAGVVLAIIGRTVQQRQTIGIVPTPGGAAVFRSVEF